MERFKVGGEVGSEYGVTEYGLVTEARTIVAELSVDISEGWDERSERVRIGSGGTVRGCEDGR